MSFIFNEETLYFTVLGGDFIMDDLKKVKNNVDMGEGFWYYIQALRKRVTQEKSS